MTLSPQAHGELRSELEKRRKVRDRIIADLSDVTNVRQILEGVAAIGAELSSFNPGQDQPTKAVYLLGKHASAFEEIAATLQALDQYDELADQLRAAERELEAAEADLADLGAVTAGRR